jgi:hypothetical protein
MGGYRKSVRMAFHMRNMMPCRLAEFGRGMARSDEKGSRDKPSRCTLTATNLLKVNNSCAKNTEIPKISTLLVQLQLTSSLHSCSNALQWVCTQAAKPSAAALILSLRNCTQKHGSLICCGHHRYCSRYVHSSHHLASHSTGAHRHRHLSLFSPRAVEPIVTTLASH